MESSCPAYESFSLNRFLLMSGILITVDSLLCCTCVISLNSCDYNSTMGRVIALCVVILI